MDEPPAAALRGDARAKIVVIDDHAEHLEFLATLLRRCGYAVDAFTAARAALSQMDRGAVSLVICDVFMPDMDGFEVLTGLRHSAPSLPIIAISGRANEGALFLNAMQQLGARAGFAKPLDVRSLLATVERLIRGD